jgi:hypothetical protein
VLLHRFSDATRPLDYFIFIKASVTVDAETALVFFGYSQFAFPRESACLSLEKYSLPTTPKEIIFLGHVDFSLRPRKVRDTTSRLEKRQAKISPPVRLEN